MPPSLESTHAGVCFTVVNRQPSPNQTVAIHIHILLDLIWTTSEPILILGFSKCAAVKPVFQSSSRNSGMDTCWFLLVASFDIALQQPCANLANAHKEVGAEG
jgi:hypothetical protein